MKRHFARALRSLAARLDPPAPLVVHIPPVTMTANQIAAQIDWVSRTDLGGPA